MIRYLLDTSVLSLTAPGRLAVPPRLVEWLRRHDEALFVSTITIAEIRQGICKLERAGSNQRAVSLSEWLGSLIEFGADRIIPFDVQAAMIAGRISDSAISKGRHPGFPDVAIAAIALAREMHLLTTNGRHFEPLEVSFSDPSTPTFFE